MPDKSAKEEWQMTAQESVKSRIADLQRKLEAIPPAPKIHGNLTRRKDFSDLRRASQSRYPEIKWLQDRIFGLKSAPLDAVIQARKPTILKALREGKAVPVKVLREYMNVKPFGNVRSVRFGLRQGVSI